MTFLGAAYQLKADYGIGPTTTRITATEANAAIATAEHFIDTVSVLLAPDLSPPQP